LIILLEVQSLVLLISKTASLYARIVQTIFKDSGTAPVSPTSKHATGGSIEDPESLKIVCKFAGPTLVSPNCFLIPAGD
jgi:hypothetical protein